MKMTLIFKSDFVESEYWVRDDGAEFTLCIDPDDEGDLDHIEVRALQPMKIRRDTGFRVEFMRYKNYRRMTYIETAEYLNDQKIAELQDSEMGYLPYFVVTPSKATPKGTVHKRILEFLSEGDPF